MKQIINTLLIVMFGTGCSFNTEDKIPSPYDPGEFTGDSNETYAQTRYSAYSDPISDTWIKNYTQDEIDLLETLSTQTFYVSRLDYAIDLALKNGEHPSVDTANKPYNQQVDAWCDYLISNEGFVKNFTKREVKVPATEILSDENQAENALFSVYTPVSKIKEYVQERVTGTGWIIDENDTHYFIASNHHVLFEPTKLIGDTVDEHNGEGNLDRCTVIVDSNNEKIRAKVDISNGDKGVIVNGRNIKNYGTKYDRLDFGVVSVKKDVFVDNNSPRKPIKMDMNISFENVDTTIKSNNYFTYGYPAGVPRYNKTVDSKWNNLMSWKVSDNPIKVEKIDNADWRYDAFFFDFFAAGGSSGSPIVDKNGNLSFLNAIGTQNNIWSSSLYGRSHGNEWDRWRNGGLPAYQLIDLIDNDVCTLDPYNWSICEELREIQA